MPKDIKLWEITSGNTLNEVKTKKLDLEGRLEDWLEDDISMISNDLMVIARQLGTDFGGAIDLLGIDSIGELVVIELKRDKTPRDVVAQALDYGSWVKDLSNDRVTEIADKYLQEKKESSFEDQFRNKFEENVPEIINENHKIIIVATELDAQTERIIEYLSDSYGVGINAMTFQYFKDETDREFVGRVFLVDPDAVAQKSARRSSSKRQPRLSREDLREVASQKAVGELYEEAEAALSQEFSASYTTRTTLAFKEKLGEQRVVVFSLVPTESDVAPFLLTPLLQTATAVAVCPAAISILSYSAGLL
jgi:hypothetical protein